MVGHIGFYPIGFPLRSTIKSRNISDYSHFVEIFILMVFRFPSFRVIGYPNILHSISFGKFILISIVKNDILDNKAGEISFQDPIYAYWLKSEYFRI